MQSFTPRRRLSRTKRLAFAALLGVGLLAFTEFVCYVGFRMSVGWNDRIGLDLAQADRVLLAKESAATIDTKREVLHPYLGWVLNPGEHPGETVSEGHFPVNQFGLLDTAEPIHRRNANQVIVGIVGGSVAWYVSADAGREFVDELRKSPRFRGREIVLVRLALPGYKQPQQLLLTTYLLSLGAEFDVLVNVDGYNEVALYPAENARYRMSPAFPRAWGVRVQDRPDPQIASVKSRYLTLRQQRQTWARLCDRLPGQTTFTLNFVWRSVDHHFGTAMQQNLRTIISQSSENPGYEVTGPQQSFANDAEMYSALVDYWQHCSMQLDRLCRDHGIEYHHTLPPNQYLADSKPIGQDERSIAILEGSPFATHARIAYPLLVRQGPELVRQGVRFHDLSLLFAEKPEPIYIDNCCHYNHAGNVWLARALAQVIGRETSVDDGRP